MLGIKFGENARYQCCCGQPIYLRNSQCLTCGSALGFDPYDFMLCTLRLREDGFFRIVQWQMDETLC